jgi:pyruvate dehydrogenase (quinone)
MKKWRRLMEERGTRTDKPVKPQVIAWELGKRLPNNAIVSCDSGTIATWWARQIPARRGQMHSISGNLATMACGLPYAIGAQVAYPGRPSIAFVGDGGLSMLMAEFSTAVKYRLPVKVIVIDNNSLGQIRWEQMVLSGNPEYGVDFAPIDFAAVARACGGAGFRVEDPGDVSRVMDQVMNASGPVLLDAIVDPFEPPLPPKINARQAKKFAESMARGEPNRLKILESIGKDKIRELI